MMKINRLGLVAIGALILLGSCRKDDNGGGVEVRDPAEVAAENDADIREYLSTHFYNYEEFQAAAEDSTYAESTGFDFKIVIDTIAGENSNKESLMDRIEEKTIAVEISADETLDHTLYYLVARQGDNDSIPATKTTDSTLVRYKGFLLNDFIFDNSNTPVWFNLSNNIRGFREFMPALKSGGKIEINEEDGTYVISGNYGIGMVFMPAGLGYYSGSGSIPAYTPIAFTVDLLRVREIKEEEED
ncbi:FKBP-type peptidyl-prolyl cis-trans isomerase [Sinomicrobium sp. M5D2P9]